MVFKTPEIFQKLESDGLIPMRYCDDEGNPTETYPLNPNGSPGGVAALCSPNGRHLAMMPHPERCVWSWQCPWMPSQMRETISFSPWQRMFHNAYKWCTQS